MTTHAIQAHVAKILNAKLITVELYALAYPISWENHKVDAELNVY